MPVETRYARSGDLNIAYQVLGGGDLDLIWVPNWLTNVDIWWEEPTFVRFFQRQASFARLILFDRRGSGLSDPVVGAPTLEERMDDIRAVMDTVGSERAAICGFSEGAPMAILFAATYPERSTALVLYAAAAKMYPTPDYPFAPAATDWRGVIRNWGTGQNLELFAPSAASDPRYRTFWGRFEKATASPGWLLRVLRLNAEVDVRAVLPSISVPTLVIHRAGDQTVDVKNGRYLGQTIPGARYVELPGDDHVPMVGDQDAILDEIQEFLTGARDEHEPDRTLSTVLFTDIVGSTELASEMGDRSFRDLVERHDAVIRRELRRHRGREVKTMGDGFLATFDGPARGIRCAVACVRELRAVGIRIRAGLHTGETEMVGDDVGGIAVHIAARVMALAGASEVLVSSTVKDLVVGSGIDFADRGVHDLKGVPGEWRVYAVAG
jgi:pimeloyl-ACP methyl ester carboxylesterase